MNTGAIVSIILVLAALLIAIGYLLVKKINLTRSEQPRLIVRPLRPKKRVRFQDEALDELMTI